MRRSRPNAFTRNERSAIDRRRRAHAHLERVRGTNTKERPDGRTRTRLLVFGIALALGALVGRLGFAPGSLEVVAVTGTDVLKPEDVARAGGIELGIALRDLDTAAVTEALTRHAWIAEAQAISLPGGQLVLAVVERRAVALLAGPQLWAVDADGVPFAPAPPDTARDLPRLVSAERPPNGEPAPELARAVSLALALPERGLPAPIEVLIAAPDDPQGFGLRLPGLTPEVVLGRQDLDARLDALAELLNAELPEVSRASRVDLRFEGQAVLDDSPPPDGAAQAAASRGSAVPSNSRPTG